MKDYDMKIKYWKITYDVRGVSYKDSIESHDNGAMTDANL